MKSFPLLWMAFLIYNTFGFTAKSVIPRLGARDMQSPQSFLKLCGLCIYNDFIELDFRHSPWFQPRGHNHDHNPYPRGWNHGLCLARWWIFLYEKSLSKFGNLTKICVFNWNLVPGLRDKILDFNLLKFYQFLFVKTLAESKFYCIFAVTITQLVW